MSHKNNLCVGILAHVDAGKTTLSEAMLYVSGTIRRAGRVDNGDAFLDTEELERARGITIFSKQAVMPLGSLRLTLLDTPGHVDFSAETERTLQVLDYAILVINGADGVQGHTRTLWRLLARYRVPVFLFVNKMDQSGADRERLLQNIREQFGDGCVDFTENADGTFADDAFYEDVAVCSEEAMEAFFARGAVEEDMIRALIAERKLFPCFFGSALKLSGVGAFLAGLERFARLPQYGTEFGAKAFKIARDAQNNRLTYLKVTGGSLRVKQTVCGEEKVNQIRVYSGAKYETAEEAAAGEVCAVTGLGHTRPGQSLGAQTSSMPPVLAPVLTYRICLPADMDAAAMLPKLRLLEEEEPELCIVWNEKLQEIQAKLMGEIQLEVLKSLIWERFSVEAEFGDGAIVYKETIRNTVEGVGHFEPLRHYAEVHLLMEPGESGSGLVFAADCSEDVLDRNWQRLVLTHLAECEHPGVLTGSAVTDMKITLKTGRAHLKHTEGGDFREATYRAVRQGLMQAESVLLEPYYAFVLEIPEQAVGRAMTDIERMSGTVGFEEERQSAESAKSGMRRLTGIAPVAKMRNYQREVITYTRGRGQLHTSFGGYLPCHDAAEVIERIGYDPERDAEHPSGSVFCAHGAGIAVPWDMVPEYMHVESCMAKPRQEARPDGTAEEKPAADKRTAEREILLGTEEIDRILAQAYNANKRDKSAPGKYGRRRAAERALSAAEISPAPPRRREPPKEEYLLVDGYNIIFAWEELKRLAAENIDGARGRLLDILCNYQGIRGCNLIAVFDAYRVEGHRTEFFDYHNIHVVYTKEAETADAYIERFAHENGKKYRVTVATSDGLEQVIIRGAGCGLLSAREFEREVMEQNRQLQEDYAERKETGRNRLLEEKLRHGGFI